MNEVYLSAGNWLSQLDSRNPGADRAFRRTYGAHDSVIKERISLLRHTLHAFLDRFGDQPLRVFRAPARINLRGMHVDTHGGYLNLMTHHRETLVAAAPSDSTRCVFTNVEPGFSEFSFDIAAEIAAPSFARPWREFILSNDVRKRVALHPGGWENYLLGAVLRARRETDDRPFTGLHAVIASDIPRGAALSSSHALAVSTLLAALSLNGACLSPASLILATQDAEWFTGARTGTSDQGAMILGGPGEFVNVALFAEDLHLEGLHRIPMPDEAQVLVINSHTRRSLSGAQLLAYTRNRFAYSLALEILRQELMLDGFPPEEVSQFDRLSRFTPESLGGLQNVYSLLLRVPEEAPIETLRKRYQLPGFDESYDRYFGQVPAEERPASIGLRGPLLFGLAESERARRFGELVRDANLAAAGRLMSLGHDGDRIVTASGAPFNRRVDDATVRGYRDEMRPLECCPGDYGASSPALDALVDAAIAGGALGASLTGAGIAGAVLALCRAEDSGNAAAAVRERMDRPDYPALAHREAPLTTEEKTGAVVANVPIAAAGELVLT